MSKERTRQQKKTLKRAPRTCSVCGKTGHNTRTCKNFTQQTQPKTVTKKKSTQAYVPVRVLTDVTPSPHVLELTKNKRSTHWQGVDVYQEKSKQISERVKVNFADMITRSNGSQSTKETNPAHAYVEPKVDIDILSEIAKIQPGHRTSLSLETNTSNRKKFDVMAPIRFVLHTPQNVRDRITSLNELIKEKFSFKRFALSSLVLLVIITLPFPAFGYYQKIQQDTSRVVLESTNAFLSLQSSTVAAFGHNIPQAQYDLNAALNAFSTAQQIIDKEYKALVYVTSLLPVVGTKVKSRQDLLQAGHNLALGNTYLVKGIGEASQEGDMTLINRLDILQQHIVSAVPKYKQALTILEDVDASSIPTEYQQSFGDFKQLFGGFIADMQDMDSVIHAVELLMGSDGFKRYLVLFQNSSELRPTGGFVGSYAVIDVQNGKVQNINVPGGGSYDMQGQLSEFVKPPLPLQIVNNRWEFQDGNWFADFPASAQKMAWFYQHARNSTVDGVIAINSSILQRLLSVIGPIENSEYEIILDAEDALAKLQYEVETYDNVEENTPKAILSVLLNQLIERMGDIKPDQVVSLVSELHQALEKREIQFYFSDEEIQQIFHEYGWTGEITQTEQNQDYLMVVNTNLGGSKSDASIRQKVYHQASVEEDGSITDTVIITRYHEGNDAYFFDASNISYVRIYVPEGAELIDAGGFIYPEESAFSVPPKWYKDDEDLSAYETEVGVHVGTGTRITNEFGKTAFANWIVTRSNEETQVYFTYKLPFKAFNIDPVEEANNPDKFSIASIFDNVTGNEELSRYSMVVQKQSGSESDFSNAIIYPDAWRPVWKVGDHLELSINGASLEVPFESDQAFGVVMKKT